MGEAYHAVTFGVETFLVNDASAVDTHLDGATLVDRHLVNADLAETWLVDEPFAEICLMNECLVEVDMCFVEVYFVSELLVA